jgi:hypothetical protein
MFRVILAASVAAVALAAPGHALAVPLNDSFAAATEIAAYPFADTVDLDGASTEPGEPQACNFQAQSVWYRIAPAAANALRIDLNGSNFGVVLNVYRSFGGGIGSLSFQGCLGFGGSMQLSTEAGATYYIQAGSVSPGHAQLSLHVEALPPPPNDDFADARAVAAVPFAESVDLTLATTEPSEPVNPGFTPIVASVWYSFTPVATGSYTVSVGGCCTTPIITAYTGDSLASLVQVASRSSNRLVTQLEEGTTYRLQVGRGFTFGSATPWQVSIALTPPFSAFLSSNPFDPSVFDDVSFTNSSFDPVNVGFEPAEWDFGDGATATGGTVLHRFAADGDYSVRMSVRTLDGRSGIATQTVAVRTHDVAIAKLAAPQSAREGQVKTIVVGLSNQRYPERVRVTLMRGDPGGFFTFVGTQVVDVPVLTGGKTTAIPFAYTFVAEDAFAGKATFKVVAAIEGARDAAPADNEAVSLPTKVH